MKKITTIVLLLLLAKVNFAQDFKKFRFGLKAAPSVSWLKPDSKEFKSEKAQLKFSYGLMTEFALSENYSFVTGLEITTVGGGLRFPDSTYVKHETDPLNDYMLLSRSYNLKYVDLPLLLKMKTNEIGYFTYFGQFGFNTSFRTKARANDSGTLFTSPRVVSVPDIDIEKDISFFRVALNLGLGAEYNIAGNTSLVFGVNYSNGFTNALKRSSVNIKDKTGAALNQKAVSNFVALNVGILF